MRPQNFCDQDQAILKDIKKTSARTQINSVLNYFLVKKGDILRKKAIWEKRKLLGKTLTMKVKVLCQCSMNPFVQSLGENDKTINGNELLIKQNRYASLFCSWVFTEHMNFSVGHTY